MTMLAVSTDSDAATALGTAPSTSPGSPDSPGGQPRERLASSDGSRRTPAVSGVYDYMVTAPYVFPFGLKLTLAALSQVAPGPCKPQPISPRSSRRCTPCSRATARHRSPSSCRGSRHPRPGLRAAGQPPAAFTSIVLNAPGRRPSRGYDPYRRPAAGHARSGLPPAEQLPNFKDAAGQLPVDGTATTRYLAAGIDVFGQWSGWTEADIGLTAAPITQPGLTTCPFKPARCPRSGHNVSS